MKVLFAALHLAYFRNFESVIRELAARGHSVHLTADEPERMGGQELAERLAAEYATVSWDLLPSLEPEPWFDAARTLRVALDYVRVLEPEYASKLRLRAWERTARAVRMAVQVPVVGPPLTLAALKRFERAMPSSALMEEYLRARAPDLVVLTSLTYSRSQQFDVLRAARALQIPVAAAIMSWDHLSSKALLHIAPDLVLVWNEVQKREAVEMHGLPAERVTLTGAQCYDQWFTRTPARSRDEFCRTVGLRADRPFVLWVHSALSPTPDPPEPQLVLRWIEALRRSDDPRLRDLGVLVRPHPERVKEWAGVPLDRFANVAFHGRNPIDGESKNDYFDSLYYSSAVVGLVTSAFLEAAIVGRPVLTITLPEYRLHQEEMVHFQYLTEVEGGLLQSAPDVETHLAQLAEAVALDGRRDDRNLRFLHAFVRPGGLDTPATPAFVGALERLHRDGVRANGAGRAGVVDRVIVATASCSQTAAGRWLLNDMRDDQRDEHQEATEAAVRARIVAWNQHREMKAKRNQRLQRREAVLRAAKKTRSALRRARARTVVHVKRTVLVLLPTAMERFGKKWRGGVNRTRHRLSRAGRRSAARLVSGLRLTKYYATATAHRALELTGLGRSQEGGGPGQ